MEFAWVEMIIPPTKQLQKFIRYFQINYEFNHIDTFISVLRSVITIKTYIKIYNFFVSGRGSWRKLFTTNLHTMP